MMKGTVQTKTLNNNKVTAFWFPIAEKEFQLQINEIFGEELYKLGKRKKGGVYLDIGACLGLASIYFRDWAKMIYAVEPSTECYKALFNNTKEITNIQTFNCAMADKNARLKLCSINSKSVPQTFYPGNKSVVGSEIVPCKTMDVFFKENKINHIDVMKLDVEGSEYSLLASPGFAKVADKIDFIIGESHFTNDGAAPLFIPEILKEYGFKTKFLKEKNFIRHLGMTFGKVDKIYSVNVRTMFYAERK